MRSLTSFVTVALLLTAGSLGCAPDPDDVFDTLVTASTLATNTMGDGDGDPSDTSGDGDGDGDPTDTTGDGDGDGDGDECAAGNLGDPCDDTCPCIQGLSCNEGECALGGGDGDGDGDGDPGGDCNTYDPMMCMMPGQLVMVGNIEGNFCSCPCMTDAECPMGPMGTQGACVLVLGMGMAATNCGLICSVANDACPAGSTCKSAGQMDPDLGLCTYP